MTVGPSTASGEVDGLGMPIYSSRHPRGHMFSEISLICEIPVNE